MNCYKLVTVPFVIFSLNNTAYAEHLELPTLSVEGVSAETVALCPT
ncbi:MAG: hypothetical protein Q9N32_01330 [Gammaproteobacteria bacterium]|nr:hypothetical protein [Gammaproteobacteria bacterium]